MPSSIFVCTSEPRASNHDENVFYSERAFIFRTLSYVYFSKLRLKSMKLNGETFFGDSFPSEFQIKFCGLEDLSLRCVHSWVLKGQISSLKKLALSNRGLLLDICCQVAASGAASWRIAQKKKKKIRVVNFKCQICFYNI